MIGFGDRIRIVGPPPSERGAALCAFTCDGVHSSDLAFFLDQEGVAVRAGHHCTQPLHKRLGADGGTVRASLALYNTEAGGASSVAAWISTASSRTWRTRLGLRAGGAFSNP